MVRAITGAKRIETELCGVEDGDELSIVIGGNVVRGRVLESREDIAGHELEVVFEGVGSGADSQAEPSLGEGDGFAYDVYVDHTGSEDQAHYEASNRDFNVFAAPIDSDVELDVTALANWEDDFDVPDQTLDELDSEAEEDMDEELEAALDSIARAMTELQEVREGYRRIRSGDDTLVDFEQRLVELELESGGTLALDDW